MYSRIEGTSALKIESLRALTIVKPGAQHSAPAARKQRDYSELLFDDERCYEYKRVDLKSACSNPIKLALVYTSALLFMVAGLALATVL